VTLAVLIGLALLEALLSCRHRHRLYVIGLDGALRLVCARCGHGVPALELDSADLGRRARLHARRVAA
jgi:hypothetical protein